MTKQIKIAQSIEKNISRQKAGVSYVYWGLRNVFPDYLFDLYKNSSKHHSIVDAKVRYVNGTLENSNNRELRKLYDVFKKLVFNYILFGGCYIRKIKVGNYIDYDVINPINVRFDEEKKTLFFGTFNTRNDIFKYSPNRLESIIELNLDEDSGFYELMQNDNGIDLYPSPEYSGSVGFIEVDCRLSNYISNYLSNGLSAGYLVNIFGVTNASEEEKESKANEFVNFFSGDDNAGRIIIQYTEDREHATEIVPIDTNDVVDKMNMINDIVQREIFVAHNITSPMLFGIRVEGQLGGRNELLDAFELFKKTYILPTRYKILDWLSSIDSSFSALKITDELPIGIDVKQYVGILTVDEIREQLGYAPLNNGNLKNGEDNNNEVGAYNDKILEALINAEGDGFEEIIKTTEVSTSSDDDIFNLLNTVKITKYGRDYTMTVYHIKTMRTLKDNPEIDIENLSVFVGLSEDKIKNVIEDLLEKGYLIKTERGLFVTRKGIDFLSDRGVVYTDVRYSYDWRDGFSDADSKNSREFCVRLMKESKKRMLKNNLWTRADIEKISEKEGRDVWTYRGGWYRVPNTNTNLPYCRHTWKQHIVIVKNKLYE